MDVASIPVNSHGIVHAQRSTSRDEPKWSVRAEVIQITRTVKDIWMRTSVTGSRATCRKRGYARRRAAQHGAAQLQSDAARTRNTSLLRIIMPALHAIKKTHDALRARTRCSVSWVQKKHRRGELRARAHERHRALERHR